MKQNLLDTINGIDERDTDLLEKLNNVIRDTIRQNGNDFNQETGCTEGIQTCIDFKRVSNWGGFVNTSVFLIHFSDDNSVEKTIIK